MYSSIHSSIGVCSPASGFQKEPHCEWGGEGAVRGVLTRIVLVFGFLEATDDVNCGLVSQSPTHEVKRDALSSALVCVGGFF